MELVRLDVAVFLAPGAVVTRAAQSASKTIPIVSVTNDPVALGFARTLAHPGGNVTGMAITSQRPTGGEMGRATQRCYTSSKEGGAPVRSTSSTCDRACGT